MADYSRNDPKGWRGDIKRGAALGRPTVKDAPEGVRMIGRKVLARGVLAEVVKWEPLGAAMCDALLKFADDSVCWYGSAELKPADDLGPLPSRTEAREAARVETLASLRVIRARHAADFNKPWPGAQHGKAIVGMAINGAIRELEKK